ncbi:type II toxin-antitoxin system RelE/ParE family toxin [Candidatus Nitrospira salsa]
MRLPCTTKQNAYRAIYPVQLDEDIWVIHAFQKKSKTGIKTPKIS